MEHLRIDALKKSKYFIENIRWDVTPKIFLEPRISSGDEPENKIDTTYGYMLYVDLVKDKPTLLIMQLKHAMSQTVGYLDDIPEDLMRGAMHCEQSECIAGMYPLTEKLEKWLKKEFGLS
jgi:hypothetical protein